MKSKGFYNNIKKYSTPPQLLLDSSSETNKPHRRPIGDRNSLLETEKPHQRPNGKDISHRRPDFPNCFVLHELSIFPFICYEMRNMSVSDETC